MNLEELYGELLSIKNAIAKLNERINLLEYNLSSEKEQKDINKVEPSALNMDGRGVVAKEAIKDAIFDEKQKAVIKPLAKPKRWTENFEQVLGEKWFNKLGILAVVAGVALLVGYSFKYMGPVAKISIGYIFGFGMLLFGNYIEKKQDFSIYGKTLIGGGWALNYFVTYAMHHISIVRLIESPIVGMFLLIGVSVLAVLHILKYRSQIATAFSYLLMFITLMISHVSFYTISAALLIAISLIFFMYKFKWNEFAIYGMIMSYFAYTALYKSPSTEQQFFIAIIFLCIYWLIFTIATLLMQEEPSKLARDFELSYKPKETVLIGNTLLASVIAYALLKAGFMEYLSPILLIAIGLYLLLTIITYLLEKKSLYIIASTYAIFLTIIYLPFKYSGYGLTVSYIILAQIILLAGIIFKEAYWRMFSFGSLLIILGKLLIFDAFAIDPMILKHGLNMRTILFGFASIIYLANYILYSRLRRQGNFDHFENYCPNILSYAFPTIYAMGIWLDLPKLLTAPCWIILGIILLQIGILKKNYHQRMQGYLLTIGAFIRLLLSNMTISGGISIFSYRLITSMPVILILYYCVILLQEKDTGKIFRQDEKKLKQLYPYLFFVAILMLARYEASEMLVAPVWGLIALIYSLRGIFSSQRCYLSISSIAAICAVFRAVFTNVFKESYLVGNEGNAFYPVITVMFVYAGNVLYLKAKESINEVKRFNIKSPLNILLQPKVIFAFSATVLLTTLLITKLSGVMITIALGIEGLTLLLCGLWIKEKNWRIFGLLVLLLALVKTFLIDLRQLSALYYILCLIALGLTLLFVSYIYTKYKEKIKKLI